MEDIAKVMLQMYNVVHMAFDQRDLSSVRGKCVGDTENIHSLFSLSLACAGMRGI